MVYITYLLRNSMAPQSRIKKKHFYDHLVMSVTLLQNKSDDLVTDSEIETLLDQLAIWL